MGRDASILRSPLDRVVRKRYSNPSAPRRAIQAAREFEALELARETLDPIPGVSAPRPIGVDPEHGELLMEYFPGEQLDEVIGSDEYSDLVTIEELAETLAEAMEALTANLPVDQLDFSIRNTMLVSSTSEIVFIDFTPRQQPAPLPDGWTKLEIALASFITSAITYQVRYSSLRNLAAASRLRAIASSIIDRLDEQNDLDLERVRQIAWMLYWRQASNRGWKRYLWFHSAGIAMFWFLLRRTA